ncbi:MAG: hypothetical protein JWQ45_999 [Blastococcus sp.]|jgi:hypothetical protein|nr:hypothetical protein [Blastococcus sp.]
MTVTVDDDVLAHGEPFYDSGVVTGWATSPAFLVTSDGADLGAAVHAARERFHLVTEDGREIDEEENDGRCYTPNRVSGVYLTDTSAAVLVDTKGDVTRLMGEAMIAILVEELTARGVSAHIGPVPRNHVRGRRTYRP